MLKFVYHTDDNGNDTTANTYNDDDDVNIVTTLAQLRLTAVLKIL